MEKIYSFIVAAVTIFAAAACTQELDNNVPESTTNGVVFTAYVDGADTKTVLSGNKSLWKDGDRIWILNGKEGDTGWKKAYSTTDDEATSATFTEEDNSYALEGEQYFAVYPATAADNASWEGGDVLGVTLKAQQTATPGSYDPAAHIAVAKSETKSLSFKNAVSLLKFTVKNEGVKSVTIYAREGGLLTGSCNISAEGTVTPWTGEGEANGWVELSAGEGAFAVGTEYYIAVFPNTDDANLTAGFTVQFSFGGAKYDVKSYTKALTLNRNEILDLGELEYAAAERAETVSLCPGVWSADDAWFAAYFFGTAGEATAVKMTETDGVYSCTVPGNYENVIFCRMNPAYAEFGWDVWEGETESEDHVWNQSDDLNVPLADDTKVYYNVTGWEAAEWSDTPLESTPDQPEVDASAYGLVGSFQDWNVTSPIEMTNSDAGWIVAENVELYKSDEFKFVKDKSWGVSYGPSAVTVVEEEVDVVTQNGQNMKVAKNGKFNLYLNPTTLKVRVECVEEYTDLTVNITIDNKANWSPLYIYLEADGTAMTPTSGALVSGNTYAVSGDYIGSTLTCKFISGDKVSEVMNVAITKDGATVTLEETVIKFTFKLETDNAKEWWGSKACMYIWNSGTSADNSWPGVEMISDGNYTWHVNLPSELAGKTIKYIINNGNGWQSADQTITISPAGHTVYETKIGIK